MTPDEFRSAGHRLIDWIADYRETIGRHPVMARTEPGSIREQLPAAPPESPEDLEALIGDLERILLPGITHWQHPGFFGYFPAVASPSSVLGDLLSTGLGVIGLSWQASPALTELEEVVLDWMRQAVGLSEQWRGVIQDSASTSTLVALICARERSSAFGLSRGGLQGVSSPLVVYASEQAHSSVEKAALLAGFGKEHVRSLPVDSEFALDPEALCRAIRADRAAGKTPCAVVATTGTTASTAIDPVGRIAEEIAGQGLWLHVDAAMAGSAMILPECRHLWEGVERADSVVLNAHKWLGAAFDCSLYYVRDPQHLVRVMSTNPSYLRSAADDRTVNYRDWGIPLGRRFRALKLWALLRMEGLERLRSRLRRDLELARWLADQARSTPGWRVVAPVPLQTVCLRHEPPGLDAEELDRHTLAWVDRVNRSGEALLTPAILEGRWMARVSIGAEATDRGRVESLWERLRREAEG
ncbi:pyridoxal phosphate-dependent decarboxylase family protein [Tautonia sociabilis]|uniref:Aspartate aminotransferase family protein n=1 Tax=Tautonia sociabilis TaxID=2080755 RepID=A0A432MHS9_9BACT|nr:pyridoxal-dependent decarboxylase [Tautonia sociabilis]RUL86913.1 aspartate aminotransferase family protein [Tautonia sociabilis]